jgi:hypothetical protein
MSAIAILGRVKMLVWEYLKENPARNAMLIKEGWRTLFLDDEVPYGVKHQLLQFSKLDLPMSDCNLYWYDQYAIAKLTGSSKEIHDDNMARMLKCKRLCETFYTCIQQDSSQERTINTLFFRLADYDSYSWLFDELTYDDYRRMVACWHRNEDNVSFRNLLLQVVRTESDSAMCYFTVESSGRLIDIFRYMSLDFVRQATMTTIKSCVDLFRDVPVSVIPAGRFKSLNDIQRAHDEQTALTVKKMLKANPDKLIYHPKFLELVTANGFKLPMTKNDMIERGALHHNCVATYADRHCRNDQVRYCRLVFAKDATAELTVHRAHNKIVAVTIEQYKGRFNKDIEQPLELTELRIALTGQSINIIHVGVEYGD